MHSEREMEQWQNEDWGSRPFGIPFSACDFDLFMVEVVQPAEEAKAYEAANPVKPDGTIVFNEKVTKPVKMRSSGT